MTRSLSVGAMGVLAFGGASVIWQVIVNQKASESALRPWDEYEPRLSKSYKASSPPTPEDRRA